MVEVQIRFAVGGLKMHENVLTDIQTNMHVCVCVHLHPHRVEQAEVAQEETLVTESSF